MGTRARKLSLPLPPSRGVCQTGFFSFCLFLYGVRSCAISHPVLSSQGAWEKVPARTFQIQNDGVPAIPIGCQVPGEALGSLQTLPSCPVSPDSQGHIHGSLRGLGQGLVKFHLDPGELLWQRLGSVPSHVCPGASCRSVVRTVTRIRCRQWHLLLPEPWPGGTALSRASLLCSVQSKPSLTTRPKERTS